MSLFKTATPSYRGQSNPTKPQPTHWSDWLRQLLKTPTPQYRKAPTSSGKKDKHDR